jgi:hypothetical protein
MPLRPDPSPVMDNSEPANTELEMRRALGLDGDSPGAHRPAQLTRPAERHMPDGQKRRFVQDGEVPVFVIQGRRGQGGHQAEPRLATNASPVNRLDVAENALRTEREARERAERILAEVQSTVHDLQTALGHAVLARDEARAAAQQAQLEKQQAEAVLAGEREALEQAEAASRQAAVRLEVVEQNLRELKSERRSERRADAVKPSRSVAEAPVAAPAARKPAAAKAAAPRKREPEPKPVKWWIKPRTKKTS